MLLWSVVWLQLIVRSSPLLRRNTYALRVLWVVLLLGQYPILRTELDNLRMS